MHVICFQKNDFCFKVYTQVMGGQIEETIANAFLDHQP